MKVIDTYIVKTDKPYNELAKLYRCRKSSGSSSSSSEERYILELVSNSGTSHLTEIDKEEAKELINAT